MRIAILAPINRRIPPRPYGPEEQMISDLSETLLERGHQVVLFAAANSLTRAELVAACPRPLVEWGENGPWPDPRWWEELHIGECVLQASKGLFDLVHNHMGAKAMPFMSTLKVPVLTSLHGAARDRQTHPILKRYADYPYVAMDQAEKDLLPGLNYVAEIPPPSLEDSTQVGPMVDAYEELYKKLVAGQVPSPVSELKRITPWGYWEVLLDEPDYKVKRIRVDPGRRLSYQRHKKRREHWVVAAGNPTVTLEGVDTDLAPGQAVDIPEGAAHRLANRGETAAVIIEVQLGEYLGEDDIERIEDDYGRA